MQLIGTTISYLVILYQFKGTSMWQHGNVPWGLFTVKLCFLSLEHDISSASFSTMMHKFTYYSLFELILLHPLRILVNLFLSRIMQQQKSTETSLCVIYIIADFWERTKGILTCWWAITCGNNSQSVKSIRILFIYSFVPWGYIILCKCYTTVQLLSFCIATMGGL
jgi:hypothetical protein